MIDGIFFFQIDSKNMQPTIRLNRIHSNQIAGYSKKYSVRHSDTDSDSVDSSPEMVTKSTPSKPISAAVTQDKITKAKEKSSKTSRKPKILPQSTRTLRNNSKKI